MNPHDEKHLQRAIALANSARAAGNHPFGAILVDANGEVIGEAENAVSTATDITGHAELNLVRNSWNANPQNDFGPCTLYTSCEPCAMCSGAIYWAGIGRVVFALSSDSLIALTGGPGDSSLALSCRQVFAQGGRATDVRGPLLEDLAAQSHHDFWV